MLSVSSPSRAFESATATISAAGALVDGSKEHCCQTALHTSFVVANREGKEPIEGGQELSRQRLRRRRMLSAKVLRGHSPRRDHEDQRRGRFYPVTACCTVPAFGGMSLELRGGGRVDAFNLMRCGSVWTCPECAQRIATHRAIEVKTVIEAARERGCRVEMITFTLPHKLSDSAEEGMTRLKAALRRFSSDGSMRRILKEAGFLGKVTSIEVTYGHVSGWHIHAHAVVVFEPAAGAETTGAKEDFARSLELKKALYPGWKRAALAVGADTPNFKHGFDVRVVWSANDYIAKLPEPAKAKAEAGKGRWGAEAELTKAYLKEGRKSSRTVWEILDGAATAPEDARLFREYAAATWGRSQMEWSKGARDLRKMFLAGAEEETDEYLAYQEPEWVFADEAGEEDAPLFENLVVERVQISAGDAWRARLYNFGSLDRAVSSTERGDSLSLAQALRDEGWVVNLISEAKHELQEIKLRSGRVREVVGLCAAEFVATWPRRDREVVA